MIDDRQLLGLYVIKDGDVTRLQDAYKKNVISDKDLDEIVKLIKANKDCENYFEIYDIIDVELGTIGEYSISYDAVDAGDKADLWSIEIGNYTINSLYGKASFTPLSSGTAGDFYVKEDGSYGYTDLTTAYNKGWLSAEEIINFLNSCENKYWTIEENSTATTETTATEPTPTESVSPTEPATDSTEPTLVPTLSKSSVELKAGRTSTITVKNKGDNSVSYSSADKKVAKVDNNGKVTALKKGNTNITVTVGNTKLTYKVNVTSSPKLNTKSITVKKGSAKTVKIIGKAKGVNNKYTNTKYAKITSKKSATTLKINGLKKGSTTLKIEVNGVALKLKVKVK
jgi:uncharacterized protein YjdB